MGFVYEEFERELKVWRRKYADRPERELVQLFLMGLEREQIVSIGYSEDRLLLRLRSMPISQEVRDIIHHALVWAWKDEQMHAIYIRGAILKFGNPILKGRAFARQMAGAVGGWAASVRQHVRWADAPASRLLATLLTTMGALTGQVPRDVRKYLEYRPFRDYCLFNIDAERTAWLSFKRMVELVQEHPEFPDEYVEDFCRTQEDEDRHCRVFEILAAALDEQDRLVAGETPDSLVQKLGEVGEFFLPRTHRHSAAANPLGGGGRVLVVSGATVDDKLAAFHRLLHQTGLAERLQERARATGKPMGDLRVAVKVSFMLGYHHKDMSPLTDPVLVGELARFLKAQGCGDVVVVEQRNLYDGFYRNRTVHEVARYFNIASDDFRIVDTFEEQVPHQYFRGLGQYTVGRTWKEADFRISFGKMRSHPVEQVHLTIGNVEGLGARCDDFVFAERQAHRDTATMMLLGEFPPDFAILDAYECVGDGLLGVMGCPRPKSPRRFYAGADALAVDIVASRHMGLKSPRQSGTLREAIHWFGDPSANIEIVGRNEPIPGWRSPYHNEWTTFLSLLAYPVYQYTSSRGAVFVPEMDEEAFPQIAPESFILRARRRSLQVMLGLRHKK